MASTPLAVPDDARRWPLAVLDRRDWFRQAPEELLLIDALTDQGKYRELLEREDWFSMILPLLARVRVASLVAAHFEYEPEPHAHAWQSHEDYALSVSDSTRGTHRAVGWAHPAHAPRRLWVDGTRVAPAPGAPFELLSPGHWISDDVFVGSVAGPEDHPAQDFGFGGHPEILGLLVVDVRRWRTHVLQPTFAQAWTTPWLREEDGRWQVFASARASAPDRVVDPTA